MLSLSCVGRSGVVEAFNSTSRYLDDLLNIDGTFFDSIVGHICPSGLRLSWAGVSDAGASILDLSVSIFVEAEVFDRRDDFGFDIVNFAFLDGGLPRSASCGACVSRFVCFARVPGRVDDTDARNARNEVLTARLFLQRCRYHKLRGAFSKFYRRHFDLVSKYNVGNGIRLLQGLSWPEFCGNLVYRFGEVVGEYGFPCRVGRGGLFIEGELL